jgi:hypothetical protein
MAGSLSVTLCLCEMNSPAVDRWALTEARGTRGEEREEGSHGGTGDTERGERRGMRARKDGSIQEKCLVPFF